jgi:hypothetical protein
MPDPIVTNDDEGESQTAFLPPSEGGSYIRNPDGSLTRVEEPTIVPTVIPQE